MPGLAFILRVSRPRFWFYLFGPYIVGLIAGITTRGELLDWRYAIFAVYFLLPANLLVYGVNDIFDYETDRLNAKKSDYEQLVVPDHRRALLVWILALNLPFLVAAAFLFPAWMLLPLAGFLFFSISYSAPPIRAKAKPVLDSAFNILYIMPAAFAYAVTSGELPPAFAMLAGALWTAAMHAYSAIPDIDADREAGVNTIATAFGPHPTLAICSCLYLAAAALSFQFLGITAVVLGSIYLILMAASVKAINSGMIFRLYSSFPYINVIAGFILFWTIALNKLLS